MKPYGVTIAFYGNAPWAIKTLMGELNKRGVPVFQIRGCPYPEMARAEQCRQALSGDVEVVVFLDANVETTIGGIEKLAHSARMTGDIVVNDLYNALSFAAVPVSVIRAMVAEEDRRYTNSAVDLKLFGDKSAPACPLASPWNRDGSPLVPGAYLSDSEAFTARASRAIGSRMSRIRVAERKHPPIDTRVVNHEKPITSEPGSQFALCVPSFGALDLDQIALVRALEKAGMMVAEIHGCPHIDQARSWLTAQALASGRGVFFLDHDIIFEPNDMMLLCEQALERDSLVAAAYCMRRSGRNIIGAFDVPPGPIGWFTDGSTLPAFYTGLGFAAIPRSVLESLPEVPRLHSSSLGPLRPWFALDCSTGFYAGEDVSFCNRIHDLKVEQTAEGVDADWQLSHSGRKCRVFIDTRIRIAHRGVYDYGIEDAGIVVPRMAHLESMLTESRDEARKYLVNGIELPLELRLDHYHDLAERVDEHHIETEKAFDFNKACDTIDERLRNVTFNVTFQGKPEERDKLQERAEDLAKKVEEL